MISSVVVPELVVVFCCCCCTSSSSTPTSVSAMTAMAARIQRRKAATSRFNSAIRHLMVWQILTASRNNHATTATTLWVTVQNYYTTLGYTVQTVQRTLAYCTQCLVYRMSLAVKMAPMRKSQRNKIVWYWCGRGRGVMWGGWCQLHMDQKGAALHTPEGLMACRAYRMCADKTYFKELLYTV